MAKVKDRYLKPVLKLYDINRKWICNLTTNNPKNSIFNLKKNMKVNEIDTLSFQIAFQNTHISADSCELLIKHEFDWYIIKSVTLNSSDTRYLNVECESEFTISKTVICEPIEIIGETPETMFNAIMSSVPDNKLNYIFKETDLTNRRSLIVESETSLFENLINMAEAFECTVRFSYGSNGEKYVSFIKESYDRGRVIRRNNNLKSLNITYDTSELFTKIMPFGADDDGIEVNIGDVNPTKKLYVENYDYFLAKGMTEEQIKNNMQTQALKVVKYPDIVDENDLYNVALKDLEKYSKPRVKGTVEYADTSVLEDSISIEPMIHEKIKIADSEIKMTLTSNITEIEIDYENILDSKITLDNVIEYKSIFKDLITQGEKVDSVITTNPITGKPSLIGSAIQGKIDASIAEIVGQVDVAEKMKPYAILFECNIVGHELYGATALGTKGLLIAKEKNIDNSWKWRTAINANGIYADELVGLKIIGEQIVAGTISSLDKSTWINLETGAFNFADKIKFIDDKFTISLSNGQTLDEWKTEYEQNKADIDKDIEDIHTQLEGITGDIGGFIADGIIDEVEANIIKDRLIQFNKERDDITTRYENLYNNIALYGEAKDNLKLKYDLFIEKHSLLVAKINEIIEDKKATDTEQEEYGIAVMEYNAVIPQLSKAFDDALNCISINTSKLQLDDLKTVLDNDIKNVSDSVTNLENTMNNAFRDGIIDETEKLLLTDKITALEVEKLDIDKNYTSISNSSYLAEEVKRLLTEKYNIYVTKHTELISLINLAIDDLIVSEEEFSEIKLKINEYNIALSDYSQTQTNATNNIIDNTINYNVDGLREEIKKDVDELNGRINDIIDDVGGAVADGIIDEAEVLIIKNSIIQLNKEKEDITARYEVIYNHERLSGEPKTNLRDKYNLFIQVHNTLVTQINEMIADNYASEVEKAEYEKNITAYSNALGSLSKVFDLAINSIADAGATAVAEAMKKELQGNIKDVSDVANGLKNDLDGYTADSLLDEAEKKSIRASLKVLEIEKKDIDSQYSVVYNNEDLTDVPKTDLKSSYDNYVTSYNALVGVITLILDALEITEELKGKLDSAFLYHNEKLAVYSERVNKAIDSIATKKSEGVKEFVEAEVEVLNNLIKLKVNTEDMEAYVKVEADKITSSVAKEYVKINDAVNYSIIIDNEHQGIPTDKLGTPLADNTYTINFQVYKGASSEEIPFTIKSATSSVTKGIVVEKFDKYINLKTSTKVPFEELEGYINVIISVGEYEFTKKITWNIVRQGEDGIDGIDGTPGIDGVSAYFHIKYAPNSNPTASQMTETPQEYMGTYSDNNPEDSLDPKRYTWHKILGKDGTSVRIDGSKPTVEEIYAIKNPEIGSGYTCEADGHLYMYTSTGWIDVGRIQGPQGIAGKPGVDGKTPYLHIKYSDDGVTFTSNNGETAGKYLGQYVDFIAEDSMVFSKYLWKRIEGFNGADGVAGKDGEDSIVATITNDSHIIPTDLEGNNGNYTGCDTTIELHKGEGKIMSGITYSYNPSIGVIGNGSNGKYTVTNMTTDSGYVDMKASYNGITYTCRFTIAKAKKGEDGTDGVDAYTINLSNDNHTFIADYNGNISTTTSITTKITAFKGSVSVNPTIGILPSVAGLTLSKNGTTITIKANIGTSLAEHGTFDVPIEIEGIQFIRTFSYSKVLKGRDGVAGTNGVDGKTTYFHIKYSSVENPTYSSQMTETVNTYIGTYVDFIEADSNDPTKYTWSKFVGKDGIPGVNGADGKTSYLHIKYSNNGTSFTSNNGEDVGSWIGQYVDYTEADSNVFSRYTWSKIKGEDGNDSQTASLSATSQVFKSNDGGETYSPIQIVVTANYQNCKHSKWQYSTGGSFNALNNGTGGMTVNGNTVTIPVTSSLYTSTNNCITLKCISDNSTVYDTLTIFKLLDRSDINEVIEQVKSDIAQTDKEWRATFKEGYNEGVTTINQHGVTVQHSNANTKSKMSADGFSILDSNDDVIAWLSSKKQWTELYAERVYAANIDNTYTKLTNLYVNHSYTGDSEGTKSKPFSSFNDLNQFLKLTPIINGHVKINVLSTGTITESFVLEGLKGSGTLNIVMNNSAVYQGESTREAGIKFVDVQLTINIETAALFNKFAHGALFYNCGHVTINGLILNVPGYGILCKNTNALIHHIDFCSSYCCIGSTDNSKVHFYSCAGNKVGVCCRVENGGIITYGTASASSIPFGILEDKGGFITGKSNTTQSASWKYPDDNSVPAPPSINSYTQSFNWTSHKTYQYQWKNWSDNDCKQGSWGYGLRGGHMFFDIASIRNFLSGTVLDGNTITLTRASSGGLSSACNVYINGSTCSGASGTPIYSNQTLLGTLAWGETKTFTLPKAIVQSLKSGTCNSLAVYVNSSAQNNYINIVNCSITLKVNK